MLSVLSWGPYQQTFSVDIGRLWVAQRWTIEREFTRNLGTLFTLSFLLNLETKLMVKTGV